MITGDNPLTACHVAKELRFTQKPKTLILTESGNDSWVWESIDQLLRLPVLPQKTYKELVSKYDLCVTGEVSSVTLSLRMKLYVTDLCNNDFLIFSGLDIPE
jgi:cation-transporting ATPase 13A1